MPQILVEKAYQKENQTKTIKYIDLDKYYSKYKPSNENMKELYERNKDVFFSEFKKIQYAEITPAKITGSKEYGESFFKQLDIIENNILDGQPFDEAVKNSDLKVISIKKRRNKKLSPKKEYFNFFKELIDKNKLPKVTMLTGEKGLGKSTFVNHLMHYYYDKENYNQENLSISGNTTFHTNFKNDTFPNIYFINVNNFKNIRVDEVRKLKQNLLKTSVINQARFVILDDVETFNLSSLNALLKIIEEPSKSTHFILINNKSKPLIETIKSTVFLQ